MSSKQTLNLNILGEGRFFIYSNKRKGVKEMAGRQERPFLANFEERLSSPRVPGVYSPEEQVRLDSDNQPVVEVTEGIMGTTRTGEHTQEC